MKSFFILLAFASLVTTVFLKKDNPTIIAQNSARFPVVLNKYLRNPDTIHYFESNDLMNSLPIYMGKHRISDTILLQKPEDYFIEGTPRNDLIKSDKTYDSLDFSGLEIVADYGTTIPMRYRNKVIDKRSQIYAYFPVYILNNNETEKYLNYESIYAKGLQLKDALFFEPIEFFDVQATCFDMNYFIKLLPGEFVLVLFKKYQGDTKGPLRIMIKNSGSTLYSAPFNASYNKSQINFGANYEKVIKPNPNTLSNIYRYFLGRIPQKFLIPNSQYQVSPEILHHQF
ncbi:MAG: hypothetical protein IPI65_15400 [Bacteroidetes bacterium]|nr:hypothetical protein [Bacteroidota bacterium]